MELILQFKYFIHNDMQPNNAIRMRVESDIQTAYTFVENIIGSCNSTFHFDCVDVLISLFDAKYNDELLVSQLKSLRREKFFITHQILY